MPWNSNELPRNCNRKSNVILGSNEPKGNLTIEKSSSNPSITDNNNCYSLEGAEYGLYNSEADANKDVNRVGTFTIKADGKANTIKDLKAKTYYLKETKAGKGYDLDQKKCIPFQ